MSYLNNIKTTTFLVDGSWTIDPRAKMVEFYLWGGGGGGGSGRCGAAASAQGGGGGGGGGFIYEKTFASSLTASPYTVTIGTGGTGGIAINAVTTNGNTGNSGNVTSIGAALITKASTGGFGGGVSSQGGGGANFTAEDLAALKKRLGIP